MNIKKVFLFFLFCFCLQQNFSQSLIPLPEKFISNKGYFTIDQHTQYWIEEGVASWDTALLTFKQKLLSSSGIRLTKSLALPENQLIRIRKSVEPMQPEGYRLNIQEHAIDISAVDVSGVFYAFQTLLQLMPPAIESGKMGKGKSWKIPCAEISDKPAFAYRGLMLDVSRHYMPLGFLKKMIDALASMKMNRLHLHLTDDQGWRMEIKKYPKLTSVGSVRRGTLIGRFPGKGYDQIEHKGYYSQEQLKELVQYAQQRQVTIIPEIELPGHSSAAIAAYPELSCNPLGKKEVQQTWGVFNDVYCPTEYTFQFIQDVLDEVMNVFPSSYIHIGGDECPKESWKQSSFCQQLIRDKDLKDEHGLQSYFIQRIENYINSKGRKIIGWDEILEGGLAPNATVMSWRGVNGGIQAASQSHDVIMTPDGYCYLNFYQSEDPNDSIAWGGLTTLKKVYEYDPVPAELKPEQRKFIQGLQANLWSEYIKSPALAEFMLFPRLFAIAETGWSVKKPGFENFSMRVADQFPRLKAMGINHSSHLYALSLHQQFLADQRKLRFTLKGTPDGKNIFYQIKGQPIKSYSEPLTVGGAGSIKVMSMLNGRQTDAISFKYNINPASGKAYSLQYKADPPYQKAGDLAWANGILGSETRYTDDEWLGFNGKDFEGVIRLDEKTNISGVSARFFNATGSWVHLPGKIEVYVSEDGLNYKLISSKKIDPSSASFPVHTTQLMFPTLQTTFIKIVARNHGIIEKGSPGEGFPAWLFVDEVILH